MKISFLSGIAFAFVVADAQPACADEPADAAAGRKLAMEVCVSCHVVAPGQDRAPTLDPPAPSFAKIAARPDVTAGSLRTFLAEPHGESRRGSGMPAFLLARSEVDSVVAYLLSLKAR
ncbi:MAG TPA: cytochrome c [Roseiarcus sp.]|nr:cytochrome c [Roseiarcus sp.]